MLRLVIGWHFLFAGLEKWTSSTWSSDAYLRDASGPLAAAYHELAGDRVKDRATVPYDEQGKAQLPAELALEWDAYLDRFTRHYGLTEEQQALAAVILDQARNNTVRFLTTDTRKVAVPAKVPPSFEKDMTVPERIALYEALLQEAKRLEEKEVPLRGKDGLALVLEKRAQANRIRDGIARDLDQQAAAMQLALRSVLVEEQRLPEIRKEREAPAPVTRLPVSYVTYWSLLTWADVLVMVGLLAVGSMLILGLLTRTACVAGAVLVLTFFLARLPLPGLPLDQRAEGQVIEILALVALATTRSGRWVGLDGLLQFLRPRNRRSALPRPVAPIHEEMVGTRSAVGPVPSAMASEEITHGS
jgi:uncharacterized membrane protein YphA (DoxX/SURF4 family)